MSKLQANKLYNQHCPTCGQTISAPRSIGPRSQNSRTHGNCASISQQTNERAGKVVTTPSMIYDLMKRFAVKDNKYPGIKFTFGGVTLIEPISQSLATIKDVQGLCETINDYADKNNMWLWEYTHDQKKYKCIGGRSLQEMFRDYPEFNKELQGPEQEELEIF